MSNLKNNRKSVQKQFGANAEKYVTSPVHAKGASLQRLIEVTEPEADWHMLDVATGGGHTAFAFAPLVAKVIATDITPQMLLSAGKHARKLKLHNINFQPASAGTLPFDDETFDCVTCRIAPHHFPDVPAFVAESWRVLKPGGKLAVVDNIVPGGNLRGKKGRLQREAGEYLNAIEKFRDPSHARCLTQKEWLDLFYDTGFAPIHHETLEKRLNFSSWASRMNVNGDNLIRLKVMFLQAPALSADFLQLAHEGDNFTFRLVELLIAGIKAP